MCLSQTLSRLQSISRRQTPVAQPVPAQHRRPAVAHRRRRVQRVDQAGTQVRRSRLVPRFRLVRTGLFPGHTRDGVRNTPGGHGVSGNDAIAEWAKVDIVLGTIAACYRPLREERGAVHTGVADVVEDFAVAVGS